MVNASVIMEGNGSITVPYNLTKIFSADAINSPTGWLSNFNAEMGGVVIVAMLAVFAIVLFIIARSAEGVKDSRAAVYSGLVVSVLAMLLFFAEVGGAKILTFNQFFIFLVGTAIAVLADRLGRD